VVGARLAQLEARREAGRAHWAGGSYRDAYTDLSAVSAARRGRGRQPFLSLGICYVCEVRLPDLAVGGSACLQGNACCTCPALKVSCCLCGA
jgi:hypothetical protein